MHCRVMNFDDCTKLSTKKSLLLWRHTIYGNALMRHLESYQDFEVLKCAGLWQVDARHKDARQTKLKVEILIYIDCRAIEIA